MSIYRRCRVALLIGALLTTSAMGVSAQETLPWRSDLQQAKNEAAQTNRLVLVHFWAPWCGPCKRLDHEVFARPAVAQSVSANYVPVKLNVDENRALVASYGVRGIPADVIVTPDGRVVKMIQSPPTADQYTGVLEQIAASVRPPSANPGNQMLAQSAPVSPYTASQPSAVAQPATAQPRVGAPGNTLPPSATTPPPLNSAPGMAVTAQGPVPPQVSMAGPSVPQPNAAYPQAPPVPSAQPQMQQPVAQQPVQQPTVQQPAMQPPAMQQPGMSPAMAQGTVPAGNPPAAGLGAQPKIALDGCCPVSIVDQVGVSGAQWVLGQPQFAATYQGQIFYLASEEARQRFLTDPARYAPVTFGNDPVLAIDQGQMVPGNRTHALYFGNRMYLFANESTLTAFVNDRFRYSTAVVRQTQVPQGPPPNGRY